MPSNISFFQNIFYLFFKCFMIESTNIFLSIFGANPLDVGQYTVYGVTRPSPQLSFCLDGTWRKGSHRLNITYRQPTCQPNLMPLGEGHWKRSNLEILPLATIGHHHRPPLATTGHPRPPQASPGLLSTGHLAPRHPDTALYSPLSISCPPFQARHWLPSRKWNV